MVIAASPGPAPAAHALPMICSVSRSSWRTCPKVHERRNVPRVEGAITRWPSTWLVAPQRKRSASSIQSAPASIACTRVNSLRPGWGRAGPLAQVDQLIGGLLDAQRLGQRGRQQQPRVGDGVGVVKAAVELVGGVGGCQLRKCPPDRDTAALAGAIPPGQRAFLRIRTGIISITATARWIQAERLTTVTGGLGRRLQPLSSLVGWCLLPVQEGPRI